MANVDLDLYKRKIIQLFADEGLNINKYTIDLHYGISSPYINLRIVAPNKTPYHFVVFMKYLEYYKFQFYILNIHHHVDGTTTSDYDIKYHTALMELDEEDFELWRRLN